MQTLHCVHSQPCTSSEIKNFMNKLFENRNTMQWEFLSFYFNLATWLRPPLNVPFKNKKKNKTKQKTKRKEKGINCWCTLTYNFLVNGKKRVIILTASIIWFCSLSVSSNASYKWIRCFDQKKTGRPQAIMRSRSTAQHSKSLKPDWIAQSLLAHLLALPLQLWCQCLLFCWSSLFDYLIMSFHIVQLTHLHRKPWGGDQTMTFILSIPTVCYTCSIPE